MARPRVFVSSTYYDLKHIRSSLDLFIEALGFESVLSEKGDIAFTPDRPLDESCYREASNADLFVLIVGGRYGTETSSASKRPTRSFFDRYDSITKQEYGSAVGRDIPIYIFVEAGVYTEYQTFLRNKGNASIKYAHVDSVNIFHLIEEILTRPRNNPVRAFERFADIESWLREQWSGLFRELLTRQSQQQQLVTLTSQVTELKEANETLKKYLEAVMTGISTDASSRLIASEEKRLEEVKQVERIRKNAWCDHILTGYKISFEDFVDAMRKAKTFADFAASVEKKSPVSDAQVAILSLLGEVSAARRDFNEVRHILGLPEIVQEEDSEEAAGEEVTARSTRTRRKRRTG